MKITQDGFAVLEHDTHISRWAEQSGRLDHDQYLLPQLLPYIPYGGVVIDGGAFIGDHTIAYAEKVGKDGLVYAFEPNKEAYACLEYNTKKYPQVKPSSFGLGWSCTSNQIKINRSENAGAAYLTEDEEASGNDEMIWIIRIDDLKMERCDFIKLDVEGYEYDALRGAENTIHKTKPVIVLEINHPAMLRRNALPIGDFWKYIEFLGYAPDSDHSILIPPNIDMYTEPQYDIVLFPKK